MLPHRRKNDQPWRGKGSEWAGQEIGLSEEQQVEASAILDKRDACISLRMALVNSRKQAVSRFDPEIGEAVDEPPVLSTIARCLISAQMWPTPSNGAR